MKLIKGFFAFWYAFLVGDDWRLAAGVILPIAVASLLVSTGWLKDGLVAMCFFAGSVASLVLSLRAARVMPRSRRHRSSGSLSSSRRSQRSGWPTRG